MEPFEINEWQQTIEELKSDLSEASPYLNYFKRFFGRKSAPTAPVPSVPTPGTPTVPEAGQKYIRQLDTALKNSQMKLNAFVTSLPLEVKIVRKNMAAIDFTKIPKVDPKAIKPSIIGKKPEPIDFRTDKPTVKPKHNLPINPIFEDQGSEWKKRADDLAQIMNDTYQEVSNVLLEIAKDSGHSTGRMNIRSLIANMKNYTVLDKESAQVIKQKLDGFVNTYKQLESWLAFFRRTEKSQEKVKGKKTP